ncbi:hypothetical protein AXG93_4303s1000 [Marchantia polymorpha subsp. ruderalis]|uniref:Uncharacterized protein n=2 Tax=Marchantia polymorpha TaxID=3197 RepID=A0A176WS45_MARPO|nr:hypothetical protein AXG93_4303s1000 [Marchantia polymorpha subsp. ruderalis]
MVIKASCLNSEECVARLSSTRAILLRLLCKMVPFALSLPMGGQVIMAAGAKSEKKGFFDWLSDALDKDGLLEVDPLLGKAGDGKSGPSPAGKKGPASAPQKKLNFFKK